MSAYIPNCVHECMHPHTHTNTHAHIYNSVVKLNQNIFDWKYDCLFTKYYLEFCPNLK